MILEAADIRAIETGTALLLASGTRPALLNLRPWHARPDAPQIDAARLRAEAAVKRAAQAAAEGHLEPDGTLAGHPAWGTVMTGLPEPASLPGSQDPLPGMQAP
jgi:hypothetical protein